MLYLLPWDVHRDEALGARPISLPPALCMASSRALCMAFTTHEARSLAQPYYLALLGCLKGSRPFRPICGPKIVPTGALPLSVPSLCPSVPLSIPACAPL